ncbi:MAG: ABC transporter substrate-binding protein [Anaerolineae bacterium]|jgi:ABC-type branched-subunit amino acid transport system substrate-binding protein|nr:ABC transporter substrate-binding protein [Anaerolineae bacterium]
MRKIALALALTLLLSITLLPARAQLPDFIQHTDCEVDLTGETITIYHFGDISGSFAFITQPLLAGLADAIAFYNANGGICGATIATDNRDTGGDPAQTQAHYDYYSTLDPKPDVMVLYASADAELLRTQVEEDQIPVIISAGSVEGLYGEDGRTPGWIYATNPLYGDQIGSFCDFVAADPMDMYADEPVIGYISWPGAFGQAAFTPETIAYCAEQGVTILETPEIFLPTDTDISGQVLNLTDAGANILYTNTLASGPFLVAKTVVDLGLEDDVRLAGVNWALDTSVGLLSRTSIGSDGLPAVNGIVGSLPFQWWSEVNQPGVQFITEQADANARELPTRNIAYILGFTLVDFYTELYIQTVNRVGSLDAVDGAAIKETMDNIDYSPLGMYNISFAGGELRAVTENRIAMMGFANADMSGLATSGDDALKIPRDDGTNIYVPVLVPLTDFAPAPDLRPGGE